VTERRRYPEQPLLGIGGVVISQGRALLIRRGRDPLAGRWSIPGGLLQKGETLDAGVRRELLEETGINVRVVAFLDVFERIDFDRDGKIEYHFVVLDYLCEARDGQGRAGGDATDLAWAAPAELGNYSLTAEAAQVIAKAFEMASRQRDRSVTGSES
jgi:8-oxo-dGTP diphosphatase